MHNFNSITGYKSHTYNGRIITFGLTNEENSFIKTLVNSKNFEVYDTNVASDLIAILTTAIVVNAEKLGTDELELLINYYTEVDTEAVETVFWIGTPKPSIELQMLFKCFDSFEVITIDLEKVLNQFH